jgi:hypothetical protein
MIFSAGITAVVARLGRSSRISALTEPLESLEPIGEAMFPRMPADVVYARTSRLLRTGTAPECISGFCWSR